MHEMSKWEFILNNPEWVAVFTSVLFAIVTSVIIWRQYCAMQEQVTVMQEQKAVMEQQKEITKTQGETSARHERLQNRLIQLQHEHAWLMQLNSERKEVLKLGLKLHLAYMCLVNNAPSAADQLHWKDLQKDYYELNGRLSTMDVAAYSTSNDTWHKNLSDYLQAVFNAISIDIEELKKPVINPLVPRIATRTALEQAEKDFNPMGSFIGLKKAINAEFFAFKKKWEDETSKV